MSAHDPLDYARTMQPEPPPHPAGRTLADGARLGQYRIVRLLGRGGMGEVYEAEHQVLRRRYALKLLPADFASRPGAIERFKREAMAMANLDHPNIVRVDEFGETGGRHWLRMELAEGGAVADRHVRSLAEYVEAKGGRLDPDEAAVVFREMLEGLAHAHEHGVVHRDLKPANVLICTDAEGNATFKIADFGLVRMVGEEWVLSHADQSIRLSMSVGAMPTQPPSGAGSSTRSLIGTYEYMSPEQKRGEDATAASDIYAVGLMMYRLLTGTELGMERPSELVAGIDPCWDAITMRALKPNPADRFPDAGAMLAALKTAGNEGRRSGRAAPPAPAAAPPPRAPSSPPPMQEAVATKPPAPRRKSSPWPWLAAFVATGALLAIVFVIQSSRKPSVPAWTAPPAPQPEPPAAVRSPQLPPLGAGTPRVTLGEIRGPVVGQNWTSPATGMEFVWIAAVNAWVGKYEVTNGEYRKKERGHNSKACERHSLNGDRQPVVQVNFDDAKAYAKWLTDQDRAVLGGARYRLPTEAEFMAYAQCGTEREYPWGNEWPPRSGQAGNYADETAKRSFTHWTIISGYNDGHPVSCNVEQSWANPWGLYGVGGNVWEACASNTGADQAWGGWRGASWASTIGTACAARSATAATRRIGATTAAFVCCCLAEGRITLEPFYRLSWEM